jgi:hypothetical protein
MMVSQSQRDRLMPWQSFCALWMSNGRKLD